MIGPMTLWFAMNAVAADLPAPEAPAVTILAETTLLDGAGVFTACPSPCAVAVGAAPVTVWSSGSKGFVLEAEDAGKVYRVTAGHPTRQRIGWILALASATAGSTTFALAGIDAGPIPYLASGAASLTGLALTIGTRPRFVEEGR